jgi:hypothetical protein
VSVRIVNLAKRSAFTSQENYIGMDVHQATISVAVMDAHGKLIMECLLETKAATIVEFIQGLQGSWFRKVFPADDVSSGQRVRRRFFVNNPWRRYAVVDPRNERERPDDERELVEDTALTSSRKTSRT